MAVQQNSEINRSYQTYTYIDGTEIDHVDQLYKANLVNQQIIVDFFVENNECFIMRDPIE